MRIRNSALIPSVVLAVGSLLPIMAVTSPAAGLQAQAAVLMSLDGTWQGAVRQANGSENRWLLKIEKAGAGWKGTLWYPDQMTPPIPVDKVELSGDKLHLDIQLTGITYDGMMAPDGKSIAGQRDSFGNKAPLLFLRATPETAWAIAEPPPPPAKMSVDADPSFDIGTIKPSNPSQKNVVYQIRIGNFLARGMSVEKLMTISMGLNRGQIVGLPDWAKENKWDIDAKLDIPGLPSEQQFDHAVQKLVMERYGLKYHTEMRTLTAYSLSVGKNGIKMKPAPAGFGDTPFFGLPPGGLNIRNATMKELCAMMQSDILDRPVVDHTELGDARYQGNLTYQIDDSEATKRGLPKAPPPPGTGDEPPPLRLALLEQLGLSLKSGKIPIEVIVVDGVLKPSPN